MRKLVDSGAVQMELFNQLTLSSCCRAMDGECPDLWRARRGVQCGRVEVYGLKNPGRYGITADETG